MNQNYLNAVYTNLILERDYEPLRTGDGLIVLSEEVKLLQKYQNGVYLFIELIDGDKLDAAAMARKFSTTREMLLNAGPGQVVHFIEVLVFSGAPDAQTLSLISAGREDQNYIRKYLSYFTVNLREGEVTRCSKASLPVDGLDKLLTKLLSVSTEEYETLPDLNRILSQKAKDYTIEFKAKRPTVTYNLIGVNIAVWLFFYLVSMAQGVDYDHLVVNYGAKINEAIIKGQYWRLLTPIFLHAGPIVNYLPLSLHLLVNCYSLYVLGQYIERMFGHYKFLTIYLIAGIIGNIASFAFSPFPAIGASGAICGLLGALLYYGLENPKVFKKYFRYNIVATIILNVIIAFSLGGLIDNFAHLGGLAGGFLAAGIVRVNAPPDQFPGRSLFLVLILLLAVFGLYYGFHHWGSNFIISFRFQAPT